jgi:predicted transcriptional regulator
LVLENILISVEARHTKNILEGRKTVELRRRRIPLSQGARVWIYSKVPQGQIEALGIVKKTVERHPEQIWREYGYTSGLSSEEFHRYFLDVEFGYVIVFQEVRRLKPILGLKDLRRRVRGFHPPQFFKRLAADGPELPFFCSALG